MSQLLPHKVAVHRTLTTTTITTKNNDDNENDFYNPRLWLSRPSPFLLSRVFCLSNNDDGAREEPFSIAPPSLSLSLQEFPQDVPCRAELRLKDEATSTTDMKEKKENKNYLPT
jgi:hypothetical protein